MKASRLLPWGLLTCGAVAAAAFLLACHPVEGFDTWWHLATGREIARDGRLPATDPFSFTSAGKPWMDHEWLWQLGAYGIFRLADGTGGFDTGKEASRSVGERERAVASRGREEQRGVCALIIVNAALIGAAFATGFAGMRSAGVGPLPAALTVLLCAWGARGRFQVRPESATLVLLAVILALLDAARNAPPRSRGESSEMRTARKKIAYLFAVPLAIAAGANLHPGSLAVAALVVAYAIGDRADIRRSDRLPLGNAGVFALAASALAATGVNPYGFRLWSAPFALAGIVRGEHYYNPEWLYPTLRAAPLFYGALIGFLALVLLARRARPASPGSIDLATLLPQASLCLLAASGIRHVGLFFVALPFAAARPLAAILRQEGTGESVVGPPAAPWTSRWRGQATSAIGAISIATACSIGLSVAGNVRLGIARSTTPVDACDFIAINEPIGRLYNDVRFGGYLAWRFGPLRPVFIDGRNELYGPLLAELEGIYSGSSPYEAWRSLVDRYDIRGALVRYAQERKGVIYPATQNSPQRRAYVPFSAYLFPSGEWALVYWDDTAMLFLRRDGHNEELIGRFAYAAVNPEDPELVLSRARGDPGFLAAVRKDLVRRSLETPFSQRASALERMLDSAR